MSELLQQGLWLSARALGLVFGALGLLWGVIALLGRLGVSTATPPGQRPAPDAAGAPDPTPAALTAERARIAALVAAALQAGALFLPAEPPTPPAEQPAGSAWVSAGRARSLRPWQPPRRPED